MGWEAELCDRAGVPAYPCLIDEKHIVAELYGMVNVPMSVWIDEQGRIVRPAEPAGAGDGFRKLDMTTFKMPDEAIADGKAKRKAYVDALRDWVAKGDQSAYIYRPEQLRARIAGPTAEQALAVANFRLGEHLLHAGHREAAFSYFAQAHRLYPENWSFFRQMLELDQAGKASGPDFWAAVQALGDKPYYTPVTLETRAR